MRKILFLLLVLVSSMAYAQKDVTKFLGIPVDGLKSEMIQKLKAKGYVYNQKDDYLTGEFNGYNVMLNVVTNNNRVWRIMISDKDNVDESSIKIRFNNLVRQFSKNKKYMASGFSDFTIPDEEDISYEMSVKSKRYEAVFHQMASDADSLAFKQLIREKLHEKYSEEQLADTTETMKDKIMSDILDFTLGHYYKKSVWFMIKEFYGKYYIVMYYDNEYNHSDGEDL